MELYRELYGIYEVFIAMEPDVTWGHANHNKSNIFWLQQSIP
jgi:hypothetical protein